MFANAVLTPEPNFEYATPGELVVWGGCMALAAVLAGWCLMAVVRGGTRRWGWLLIGAVVCLTGGCVAATQGHARRAKERMEQFRKEERESHDSASKDRALQRSTPEPSPTGRAGTDGP